MGDQGSQQMAKDANPRPTHSTVDMANGSRRKGQILVASGPAVSKHNSQPTNFPSFFLSKESLECVCCWFHVGEMHCSTEGSYNNTRADARTIPTAVMHWEALG